MRDLRPWRAAVIGGVAAAAATAGYMLLLRSLAQVRTVPERLLEAILLFVPPATFEAGLQRFGFDAKRYGLYAATAAMVALLAAFGAISLRRYWRPRTLLAIGVGLWLFVMVVVMPLTSAGFFGTEIVGGTQAAIIGHVSASLLYAALLAIAGLFADWFRTGWLPLVPSRRALVALLGGAIGSLVGTYLLVLSGPSQTLRQVRVLDPQEPVPSGGIDPPRPHPDVVNTPPALAAGDSPPDTPVPQPTVPVGATREATPLPEPAPARELRRDQEGALMPSGRRLGELSALITPNEDFYVVTKNAAGDPVIRPAEWRLRIDGDVQQPLQTDYVSLRNLPAVEVTKTLECISNFVAGCEQVPFGCDLISTARWKGVRMRDLLALAGEIRGGAQYVATISADEFTSALPMDVALDPDTLLVYEMNGRVLPREHGYPARVLVPGRYGMKNAKWVVALRVVSREFVDWYGQRNWTRLGVVKPMTRIDVPARDAVLPAGLQRVAGIAYGGHVGISRVEISVDGGMSWAATSLLEPAAGRDAWVRWEGRFALLPGEEVILLARAVDGSGTLQPEAFTLPQPDGASGWPSITVRGR